MSSLQALLLLSAVAISNIASIASAHPSYSHFGSDKYGAREAYPVSLTHVNVPGTPDAAGAPVLESFVSFSLEFAFFPDFAGNKSIPNTFSDNLLLNLGSFQGTKPNIRVGGNTQDFATFDAHLTIATNGTYFPSVSQDYPLILSFGPSFFESYTTWPNVHFTHGFNLAGNSTANTNSILDSVPYACKALSKNNFLYWEMGNEPDLYKTSAQGIKRPADWNETDYVSDWKTRVAQVKEALRKNCGADWISDDKFQWLAPSFAGVSNSLNATKTWRAGLDSGNNIGRFSSHNYIGGATQPGVTLAGTLMNHTKTVSSVAAHNKEQASLKAVGMNLDYIIGEGNSLYNEGAPGLSNSFGAALWGVDFNLYCAATDIKQVFMHQGTDYRYASWQPVTTNKTTIGTKAPYYGNVAVAAALGNITASEVRVQNILLRNETETAYSIYSDNTLKRIMVLNMQQYNYSVPTPHTRPKVAYNLTVPTSCSGQATVQRLIANGSDAITGITFNGISYNYELDQGKPKLLGNVTTDEVITVGSDGGFSVEVPWSSAALVQLSC